MKFNHYIIASLPKLHWDQKSPFTLKEFLEHADFLLEPYQEGVDLILLVNEIRNIELVLKEQIKAIESKERIDDLIIDIFEPSIYNQKEIEKFLEHPAFYYADEYPEFLLDFFDEYTDVNERYANIELLYVSYFTYLKENKNSFFKFYGNIFSTVRTVLSAYRLIRLGKDLEENLVGDIEVVKIILEHRTTSDLGLRSIFPEIAELISLFDKAPLELEKELDRIMFNLLEDVGQELVFGDHVIYCFLIELFIQEKWHTLNQQKGELILDNIISG